MKRPKLPTSSDPIRYICTGCGAWRDGDATKLIVGGITGYEPDSPDAQQIASARQAEMPFIGRHMKTCRARIRMIYPNSPEWGGLERDNRGD
jgi:hypothetical protein